MTEEYYIGQIFIDDYPAEAAQWCNNNNCYIDPIEPEDNHKRFEIFGVPLPTANDRKKAFLQDFFKVGDIGYYRKKPKGYQSAIESINTAFNICSKTGGLPANTLIFYPEPNFKIEEQCTEQWLIAHQIKLPAMTAAQFDELYIAFVTAWNEEEH
jgi:hypothetical protein